MFSTTYGNGTAIAYFLPRPGRLLVMASTFLGPSDKEGIPIMNSNLAFECRPEYLYALIQTEAITPHRVRAYLSSVREKCLSLGQTRVMIERDIPCVLSGAEYLEMAEEMVRALQGIKAIWVNPYPELQQDLEFLALVGNNRGGHFEIAQDIDEAEEWLGVDHCSPVLPIVFRSSPVATV